MRDTNWLVRRGPVLGGFLENVVGNFMDIQGQTAGVPAGLRGPGYSMPVANQSSLKRTVFWVFLLSSQVGLLQLHVVFAFP